jgi:cytochrome c oxidase cbb3-type subunit I
MWRAQNADGSLTYTFVESLIATFPYYVLRVGGGLLVIVGMVIMAINMTKTYAAARRTVGAAPLVPVTV